MTEVVDLLINLASYNNFGEKMAELVLKATNFSTPTNSVDSKCKETLVCLVYDLFVTSIRYDTFRE